MSAQCKGRMPRLQNTVAREAIYNLIRECGPISGSALLKAVAKAAGEGIMPPYADSTIRRVTGSLINDGIVRSQLQTVDGKNVMPRKKIYSAIEMEDQDGLLTLLRKFQTSKYVSDKRGEAKTGYNAKKKDPWFLRQHWASSKDSIKSINYNKSFKWCVEDGTEEDRSLNWFDVNGHPVKNQYEVFKKEEEGWAWYGSQRIGASPFSEDESPQNP